MGGSGRLFPVETSADETPPGRDGKSTRPLFSIMNKLKGEISELFLGRLAEVVAWV